MLTYRLLKNHAGILLMGDYKSLTALHEVVHEVNEKSPILKDKEGSFLGLAYDVRKAYERQREVIKAPENCPEIGTRFGVQILWPVLLVQCRMLRSSMSYIDTTKNLSVNSKIRSRAADSAARGVKDGSNAGRIVGGIG